MLKIQGTYENATPQFKKKRKKTFNFSELRNWASNNLVMGAIDVNIMTKIDKSNFKKNEKTCYVIRSLKLRITVLNFE